jgi:DNA mismatch repair protein MutS
MDEIGRGTGTSDGLAIARAVCRFILERIGARTLFATHFHELTDMVHPRIVNLSMDVRDRDGEIVFLKRVREGPSSNSYGIHVARLAGMPGEVLADAERMLAQGESGPPTARPPDVKAPERAPQQPQLFSAEEMVLRELLGLALDSMTPLDAMNRIAAWKRLLSRDNGA